MILDTNLMYFLIGVPVLLAVIIWLVLYSRKDQTKHFAQTSIKSRE